MLARPCACDISVLGILSRTLRRKLSDSRKLDTLP